MGTANKSFMETSFEIWVTKLFPKLTVIPQQPFTNFSATGNYYVDFFFPQLNLAIELDGTQHELP
ncbi:MAG: DUF559 domain-containing protein, partial [Bacteroidota bacterium]